MAQALPSLLRSRSYGGSSSYPRRLGSSLRRARLASSQVNIHRCRVAAAQSFGSMAFFRSPSTLASSRDLLAIGDMFGGLSIVDTTDAAMLQEHADLAVHDDQITDLHVFHDHGIGHIVTSSDDTELKCTALREADLSELHCMRGHHSFVTACDVSADHSLIFSSSDDKSIRVWSLQSPLELLRIEVGAKVNCVRSLPASKYVLLSNEEFGGSKLWDIRQTRTFLEEIRPTLENHTSARYAHALHDTWGATSPREPPNSCTRQPCSPLASRCDDGVLRSYGQPEEQSRASLFDKYTRSYRAPFVGHRHQSHQHLWLLQNGDQFLTSAVDERCFKRWNTYTGAGLATYLGDALSGEVEVRAAVSTNEQWLASGTTEGSLRVWSLDPLSSDELTPSCYSVSLSRQAVGSVCFNGDDTQIACGGMVDGCLYIVEL